MITVSTEQKKRVIKNFFSADGKLKTNSEARRDFFDDCYIKAGCNYEKLKELLNSFIYKFTDDEIYIEILKRSGE